MLISALVVKHNFSGAALYERFRKAPMATVSNFTFFQTEFKGLNERSFQMGIIIGKQCIVCYNRFTNPTNLGDDGYLFFFYCNPVPFTGLFIQQPAFRKYMSNALAKEFDGTVEFLYSEVKSSNGWQNELVPEWNFVTPTMILNTAIDKALRQVTFPVFTITHFNP